MRIFFCVSLFSSFAFGQNTIVLSVGDHFQTKILSSTLITITNPKPIKVLNQQKFLTIVARNPGVATITSPNQKLQKVVVLKPAVFGLYQNATSDLKKMVGLELHAHPKQLTLNGTIYRIEDWKWIQELVSSSGNLIKVTAKLSPSVYPRLKQSITRALKKVSIPGMVIDVQEGTPHIYAPTIKPEDLKLVKAIAKQWGALVITGSKKLPLKPMIEVEVMIVELKKNTAQKLGLKLPGAFSATILPSDFLQSFSAQWSLSPLEGFANASKSYGRLLAHPRLLCQSSKKAEFFAGGEIPIRTSSWSNSNVDWKKYGVLLEISPVADFDGNVSTKIATEVSQLDHTNSVDSIPGLQKNRIETYFNLKGSQTIALSGLIKKAASKNIQGTPLLSDIPVLGPLFRSKAYQNDKTELVIFVRPQILMADNLNHLSNQKKFLERFAKPL